MILTTSMSSTFHSCLELVGVVAAFILVIIFAYFATQWVAKSTVVQNKNKNIKVVETHRINQNKYVQILKIGNKFIAIGVGKDEVNFLSEIPEESIQWEEQEWKPMPNFKEVLEKMNEKRKNIQKNKNDKN